MSIPGDQSFWLYFAGLAAFIYVFVWKYPDSWNPRDPKKDQGGAPIALTVVIVMVFGVGYFFGTSEAKSYIGYYCDCKNGRCVCKFPETDMAGSGGDCPHVRC